MTKAGSKILSGLQEAVAHAEGKETNIRVHTFEPVAVDVRKVREKLALSQENFAATLGIKVSTLKNWEQQRRKPEGPARVLLAMLDTDMDRSLEIIEMVRTRSVVNKKAVRQKPQKAAPKTVNSKSAA